MVSERHYNVWIEIEEYDPEKDDYEIEHTQVGPKLKTKREAKELYNRLIDMVTNDGEVVWVPEQAAISKRDCCPQCGDELMAGPNGSTICSKNGCVYWRA